jgi:hypothetical protein
VLNSVKQTAASLNKRTMYRVYLANILKQHGEIFVRPNHGRKARHCFSSSNKSIEEIKKEIDQLNTEQMERIQFVSSRHRSDTMQHIRDLMKSLKHGRLPPEIHKDFILPKVMRSNKKISALAQSLLYQGFLCALSNPWMMGFAMAQDEFDPIKTYKDHSLKRFGNIRRATLVEKYTDRFKKVGAIVMEDPKTDEPLIATYDHNVRNNFSNAPSFSLQKSPPLGQTHVALGFNDLQVLLPDADSTVTMDPVRFIGYDRSTYSIAKTLVLTHMLRSIEVQPHHIIDAWYSTTWTYETLVIFRSSCLAILSKELPSGTAPPAALEEIRSYLQYWASVALPLTDTDGTTRWFLESVSSSVIYTNSCSFHQKQHRDALLNYSMTGEFGSHCFAGSNVTHPERVSSLVMFHLPDGSPSSDISSQNRVSETILTQSLLEEVESNGNISITEAMYNIKVRQIRLLQEGMQSGDIQLDIRYGGHKTYRLDRSKIAV